MTVTPRVRITVAGAALAVALAPAGLAAQQELVPIRVTSSEAYRRAETLHARAAQESESLNRLKNAAKLHESSAALRDAADPRRAECLRDAALLRYFAADRTGGLRSMERAAESAAERGDVVLAAQSYSDAAIIAHELGRDARAWELGVRADVLTSSPLLSDAQRDALRERIVQLDREARVAVVGGRTIAALAASAHAAHAAHVGQAAHAVHGPVTPR